VSKRASASEHAQARERANNDELLSPRLELCVGGDALGEELVKRRMLGLRFGRCDEHAGERERVKPAS
jgi:hypothetical protein